FSTPLFSLSPLVSLFILFFFNDTPPTDIYTLSLHDALPILSRFVFGARVYFVVAVASPGTKRSVQTANFVDAIGNRIATSGDEIAGDDSEVGAETIGHIHGAANLRGRHIAAKVNIADLHDLHAVESGREVGNRYLHATEVVVHAFGGKTIHGDKEWSGTRSSRGGAKKVAAARISNGLSSSRSGLCSERIGSGFFGSCGVQPSPETFQPVDSFDRDIGEKRAEKPETTDNRHNGTVPREGCPPEHQTLSRSNDYEQEQNDVGQTGSDSERRPAPMRR